MTAEDTKRGTGGVIGLPRVFSRVPAVERYVALGALGLSLVLTGVKFWAYAVTGSAAVFSDALESIVNVLASGFSLYSVALSHAPADDEHPYGHGKIEFISAAFEGGMIFLAGAVVIWRAVAEWAGGSGMSEPGHGAALVAIASLGNLIGGAVLLRVGKARRSMALEADGKHLISDVVTSVGVLVSLGLVYATGQTWIDVLAATLVGVYLFYVASGLIRRSTAGLMDEQDSDDDRLLRQILDRHASGEVAPAICSYHKLRHRHAGRMHWVDFHLQVPPGTTTFDAHEVAGAIEGEIERALGDADATAHMEPCTETGCTRCANTR